MPCPPGTYSASATTEEPSDRPWHQKAEVSPQHLQVLGHNRGFTSSVNWKAKSQQLL